MSDILEESLQRLKDSSGQPVLDNPDLLIDAVMEATEPARVQPASSPLWLTLLRICSSAAAVLLIVMFIGLQKEPQAQTTAQAERPRLHIEDPVQYYNNSLIVARKISSIKENLLCRN